MVKEGSDLGDLVLLLFLKINKVKLPYVIWSILFRNQMMISRRQEDPGQSQERLNGSYEIMGDG